MATSASLTRTPGRISGCRFRVRPRCSRGAARRGCAHAVQLRPRETGCNRQRNLAARAGRWSAQHRKKAIFGWLAFVIIAFVIGGKVGTNTLDRAEAGVGESGRADRILDDAFPNDGRASTVLVQSNDARRRRPGVPGGGRRRGAGVSTATTRARSCRPYGKDATARSPPTGTPRSSRSRSRATSSDATVEASIDARVAAVDGGGRRRTRSCRIEQFGDAQLRGGSSRRSSTTDLQKADDDVAAADAAHPACSRSARWSPRASRCCWRSPACWRRWASSARSASSRRSTTSINQVILLIGLAVGVDYALFYLRRAREERAAGRRRKRRSRPPRRPRAAPCSSPASP